MLNRLLAFVLPLLLLSCAPATVYSTTAAPPSSELSVGAVSAADPRATEAGMAILRAGGSAADAALATMVALTVVEPQSSGIGGGSFLIYHDQTAGRVHSYDGRETAPAAAGPDWFLGSDGQPRPYMEAMPGGRSVGVPGNFRLMALAHAAHGRLAWAELFRPAIRLARDGFRITPRLFEVLASTRHIELTPQVRRTWYGPDGQPKPVGTLVRNPELADLLGRVARYGADHYYTGAPAEAVVRTVSTASRNPSPMTTGDFASYDAKERPVVCGEYRSHRICGMGPPSSGATTVFAILKQLERFDLQAMGPDDPRAWHLFGESMRLAYADRDAFVGDPDFVAVPVAGMIDAAYLASRSRLISPDRAMTSVAAGRPPGAPRVTPAVSSEVPATSHLVAVDAAGNVASLTSTIEGIFGSGLTVDGYFLNNELTDFSFAPEQDGAPVANRVEGGKRPRSSMSPTIAYGPDGSVRIAVGAAGGPTIIAQVAKTLIGVIDWNLSAQDALALPSFYLRGDRLLVEQGSWLEPMVPELRRLGGNVTPAATGGKLNAVERVSGRWRGAADPRSEGLASVE
jgi:gamma-glutamyltranspeptidase / glutathione hydrolase